VLVDYAGDTKGSSLFKCPAGHEWGAALGNVIGGGRCPICVREEIAEHARLSEDEVRHRLAERDDVELVRYSGDSKGHSSFRCPEGHEWEAAAVGVLRGRGCAYCAAERLGRVFRLTEDEIRLRLADRDDVSLLEYGGTGAAKSKFRCREGHEWLARTESVFGAGRGCQICALEKLRLDQTFDETTVRALLSDRADLSLVEYGGRSKALSLFRCTEGHQWRATSRDVLRGSGCPTCSPTGFDSTAPALVYVLQREDFAAIKVGITGQGLRTDRLAKHRSRGWKVMRTWPVNDGLLAAHVERAVVRLWRGSGLPPAVPPWVDGWTETVAEASFSVEDVVSQVNEAFEMLRSAAIEGEA